VSVGTADIIHLRALAPFRLSTGAPADDAAIETLGETPV
jgi:hypothetical protein